MENETAVETPLDVSKDMPIAEAIKAHVPVGKTAKERVEAIASATFGRRKYLNGLSDKLYWSDYKEDSDDDMPCGVFFTTPLEALKAVLEACDFLVDPETNETMLMVVR